MDRDARSVLEGLIQDMHDALTAIKEKLAALIDDTAKIDTPVGNSKATTRVSVGLREQARELKALYAKTTSSMTEIVAIGKQKAAARKAPKP